MPKKSNATAITREIKELLETCDNGKEFFAFFASKTRPERDKYVDAFIELSRKQFNRFRNDGSGWTHYRALFVKGYAPRILDTWAICWFLKAMDYLPNLQDTKAEKVGIAGYLAANPDLIDHEFWAIFEEPHERFFSFTTADDGMYGDKAWRKAILRMERRRVINRARLLDGIIKVFGYQYTDFETRWFCKLLQELKPTDDEIVAREISLYPHLESNNPCVVGIVFDLLEQLRKSNKINESLFLDHCSSLLRDKSKARIKKTLSILEGIMKRQEVPIEQVHACFIEAMRHESADIQSAALKLLLKYSDLTSQSLQQSLQAVLPTLSSVARDLIPASLRLSEPMTGNRKEVDAEAKKMKIDPYAWNAKPIHRIGSLEEFLDLTLKTLEKPVSMGDVECLIDYMAVTRPDRNDDFRKKTAALLKRVTQVFSKTIMHDFFDDDTEREWAKKYPKVISLGDKLPFDDYPLCDVASTVLIWLLGEMCEEIPLPKEFEETKLYRFGDMYFGENYIRSGNGAASVCRFFSLRMQAVSQRFCDGTSHPLLSTPTHDYCQIDPLVFSERLKDYLKCPGIYDRCDLVLALCRLAPINRKEALSRIPESSDEYVSAARYALGGDGIEVGSTAGYWISAARSRSPFEDAPKVATVFPGFGPDAAEVAKYRFRIKPAISNIVPTTVIPVVEPEPVSRKEQIDMPSVLPHYGTIVDDASFPLFIDFSVSLWPIQPEATFFGAITLLSETMDKPGSLFGLQHYFTSLARPGTRFGENALMMLALGLAHKNPEIHLPSSDIVIASIAENRLDIEAFSEKFDFMLPTSLIKMARLLKQYEIMSQVSPKHASAISDLLENAIPMVSEKDLGSLLEMLYEQCRVLGRKISKPKSKDRLSKLTGTGKAAKLAKKLLEL